MKDQFSGTPNEDVASHLNTFVELRDMQKKKDMDNDVVKMKLFLFSLRDSTNIWFSSSLVCNVSSIFLHLCLLNIS